MGLTIDYLRVGSPESRDGITKVPIQFAFSGDSANATLTEDGTVITAREFYNTDYEFWVVPLAGTHTFDLSIDDWIPFYNAESKSITVTWSGTGGSTGGGDTGGACPKGNSYPAPWAYPFETCADGYTFDLDFSRKEATLCRCNSITHEDLNKEKDTSIAKYLPYAIVGFLLIFLLRR